MNGMNAEKQWNRHY